MIVKLKAPLKDYIWGGTKLKSWGKQTDLARVAESWELSFCQESPSTIVGGEHDGKPLMDVATDSDLGKNCQKFSRFPALVKFIDAAKPLSVQVHPSDDYALQHENQLGKTEMWYILEAEPNAHLLLGLKQTVTEQQFLQSVQEKTVTQLMNQVPVHAGETYFVPSGTLHAIGAGVTLIEIQQNSTLTYRVYDFDRVDDNGNKRELHLDKALKVINFNKYDIPDAHREGFLGGCKYFSAYRHSGATLLRNANSFTSISVVNGQISINGTVAKRGETYFVSAGEKVQIAGDGDYVTVCVD